MALLSPSGNSVIPRQRKERHSIPLAAWLWIGPALILECVFFVYPLLNTMLLSFQNADSTRFVGLKNYQTIFTNASIVEVLQNNLLWLALATLLTVGLGLVVAVLVDRVKGESVVKSLLFIPMAISFVGAGVIWRFVYLYEPENQPQIGLLNALLALFKLAPHAWLIDTTFNNFALIGVYVWMWTGFCVVILSAALKGVPDEIIEAAKIDGAGRLTLFWRIIVPMIMPTLSVVTTTMVINILKIFDVVYVMTGGDYKTNVVALEFYNQLFNFNNYGVASALAVLLLLTIAPIMYVNVRRMRTAEAQR